MSLYGAAAVSISGTPNGRQRVAEIYFANPALCSWKTGRAEGRSGESSGLKSNRMFMKYRDGKSSPRLLMPSAKKRNSSSRVAGSGSQIPERSGLPFDARGARAERLGLPSRVRGVPGVG